jgi:hypothetical protein
VHPHTTSTIIIEAHSPSSYCRINCMCVKSLNKTDIIYKENALGHQERRLSISTNNPTTASIYCCNPPSTFCKENLGSLHLMISRPQKNLYRNGIELNPPPLSEK